MNTGDKEYTDEEFKKIWDDYRDRGIVFMDTSSEPSKLVKFTDRFFKFPIRIYDSFDLETSLEREKVMGVKEDIEFVISTKAIPGNVCSVIEYHEVFSRRRGLERAKEKGCDCTLVLIKNDEWLCTWKIDKFEDELNKFMEEYTKLVKSEMREVAMLTKMGTIVIND